MAGWGEKANEVVKEVSDVKCNMEGRFFVKRHDGFDMKKYQEKEDCWFKTYVIDCGSQDGERIDLFELQRWFDDNREWINGLKKELIVQKMRLDLTGNMPIGLV